MILDEKTQLEFGYTFESTTDKNMVYIQCDYCGKIVTKLKGKIRHRRKIIPKDSCGDKSCTVSKRAESCMEKYGVTTSLKNKETKAKIAKTNLEKYGCESPLGNKEVQEKIKNTNISRYGTENPILNEEIKQKIAKTNLEKYGCESPLGNKEVQEKIKNTNISRYGTESPLKNKLILEKLFQTNTSRYGSKSVSSNNDVKEKIKEVNLEKYGVEHPSKLEEIQNKKRETVRKKYGVNHISELESTKEKRKATWEKKYGVSNPSFLPETIKKIHQTKMDRYGTTNVNFGKTEKEIKEWLNSFNFNFKSDTTILEGKEIDLLDRNIGIEYCGLFWHTELSLQPRKKNYHYSKYKKCLDNGIRLITIFSDEWENRNKQVKNLLKSILGKFSQKIYARKTKIKEITKEESNDFFEENHIQGKVNSIKIAYGIYYDNELFGVISLGNHHRQKNGLVLNRLCFKDGVQVIGGASKLFAKCINWAKENAHGKIISWSDNRWSQGNVYKKLGFNLESELNPDYSYVNLKKPTKRFSKQSFKKKKKNIPDDKTELEWTIEQGYARIWDCGKKRWVFNLER